MSKTFVKSEPANERKTVVVNLRREDYDVYIGRAEHGQEHFGNPHPIGFCKVCDCIHDRTSSIEAFKKDFNARISQDPEFKNRVLDLKGKKLGCFCKPKACHGDVIANYVDSQEESA